MTHGTRKCTSPKASACPHLPYELAWTFLAREENALGRGSNHKKTDFSCHCPRHSWTWQSASLHGIAEDSQTLKDVFALVPFTKSHGEVSIQQINRSTKSSLSRGMGGHESEIKALESVTETGKKKTKAAVEHMCRSRSVFSSYWYPRMCNSLPLWTKGQGELAENTSTSCAREKTQAVRFQRFFRGMDGIFQKAVLPLLLRSCRPSKEAVKGCVPAGSHPPFYAMPQQARLFPSSSFPSSWYQGPQNDQLPS